MTGISPRFALSHALQDYTALKHILLGDLRDLLEEPLDEENRGWLVTILDALLDTEAREFQLRERGGFLEEVLEQFPNWDTLVQRLYAEHDELFANLATLRERIAADVDLQQLADAIRADLRDWMNLLTRHHRHTRRIVQAAFTMDVGCGD